MAGYMRTATFLVISGFAVSACELGEDRDPPSGTGTSAVEAGVTASSDAGAAAGGGTGGSSDAGVAAATGDGGLRTIDGVAALPLDVAVPIVFVHGYAGSAQQYYSQAMRFEANGYPVGRIRAFEHHGGMVPDDFPSMLDTFVNGVLAEFKVPKVYLVGHSRGTSVSAMYMGDPARAAKVAKYISLDGFGCSAAATASIPCIEPNQRSLPGQSHVEVATSVESFVEQYKFLVGSDPKVTAITKQTEPVVISGRAVNFPENTGRAGVTLDIYEINTMTGARVGAAVKTYTLPADGAFGPLTVSPDKRYEMVLSAPGSGGNAHHHYMQSFVRSSPFVRLLSGPADTPSRMNTNSGPGHSAIIAMRMREWQTSDKLEVSTMAPGKNQPATNVIIEGVGVDPTGGSDIASLVRGRIGIHLHDDVATPGMTTLAPLPWFSGQPFQTGVDLYMPAAEPTNGTITVKSIPRGDAAKPQVIAIPNWPSAGHLSTLMFADYAQD
jgi:pimeloyl-ACP methyl ester carboxylesterase